MNNREISVFYGADLLPYKDSARSVHYPITGNSFAGSNNTNTIRFYVDQIGGTTGLSWVVVSKLPNGKLGYEPITRVATDSEINENYLDFELSSYYTQYKGVVKLALRAYQGQISFTEGEGGVYQISGIPLIEVTGTIDFAINYSPFVNTGAQLLPTDVDLILAALSGKANISDTIIVVPTLPSDLSAYSEGQVFFNKTDKQYYIYENGELVVYPIGGGSDITGAIKKVEITSITTAQEILSQIGLNNVFYYEMEGEITLAEFLQTTDGYKLYIWNRNGAYYTSDFKLNELYNNVVANISELATDNYPVVTLSNSMEILSNEQMLILEKDNSIIKYSGRVYVKANESTSSYEYESADYDITPSGAFRMLTKYSVTVGKTNRLAQVLNSYYYFYDKDQIDTKLEVYDTEIADLKYRLSLLEEAIIDEDTLSLNYLTNALIPNVSDNNYPIISTAGLDLVQIKGHSFVYNQLLQNGNFVDISGWGASGTFSVSNNVGTFVANTANGSLSQNLGITPVSTHKYLVKFDIQLTTATDKIVCLIGYESPVKISIPATTNKQHIEQIIQLNATNAQFRIYFRDTRASDWDTIKVSNVNLFDLTQMFGIGNESTSVVEFNRLFPKPYYEYNAGEIIDSKPIALISHGYNLFDGTISATNFYLNSSGGLITDSDCDVSDYIKVIAGKTYTLENIQYSNPSLCWYDKDKNFISGTPYNSSTTKTFTAPNNAYYCRFTIIKAKVNITCFHLNGTRTGYAPYKALITYPLSLPFSRSAGSVQDVLYSGGGKKRVVQYTITGQETFGTFQTPGGSYGQHYGIAMDFPNSYQFKRKVRGGANSQGIASKYFKMAYANNSGNCYVSGDGERISFVNDNWTDETTFKNNLTGIVFNLALLETEETDQPSVTLPKDIEIEIGGSLEVQYDNGYTTPSDFVFDTAVYKPIQ